MIFEKFNPAAWLESDQCQSRSAKVANPANNAGDDLQTLATFATLAASDGQRQNFTEANPAVPATISDVAVDHPVTALPALVQAVLDRWPGAVITAVRRSADGKDREFKQVLTCAEASAEVTATLPPPEEMDESWARRMWRQDFGFCHFVWVPPLGEARRDYALIPPPAKKSRRGRAAADAPNAPKDDAPDLQTLVTKFGSYAGISEQAWTEFGQTMAEWNRVRRETYEKEKTASRHAANRQHDKGRESRRA
jgi:hypothetical protein